MLLSKIARNGYKILYLTSRPLPDWHAKKGMDGGVGMPRGPVLCSPEAFFRSPQARDRRSSHQKVGACDVGPLLPVLHALLVLLTLVPCVWSVHAILTVESRMPVIGALRS